VCSLVLKAIYIIANIDHNITGDGQYTQRRKTGGLFWTGGGYRRSAHRGELKRD
jgi:hypothetical protein